jgi:hypothetical protein
MGKPDEDDRYGCVWHDDHAGMSRVESRILSAFRGFPFDLGSPV